MADAESAEANGRRLPIRVLVAEDHALVREGTRALLEADPEIVVMGEAASGREAVELALRLHPDVVLLDVQMPDVDGIEAARRLRAAGEPCAVVMLTAYDDEPYIAGAIEAGASGYVLKNARSSEVIAAVKAAAAGEAVLSPEVQRRVVRLLAARRVEVSERPTLTEREREVLRLVAEGLSNKEVAAALGLSPRTVQTHLQHVMHKLGAASRVDAVVRGLRLGLVDLGELRLE